MRSNDQVLLFLSFACDCIATQPGSMRLYLFLHSVEEQLPCVLEMAPDTQCEDMKDMIWLFSVSTSTQPPSTHCCVGDVKSKSTSDIQVLF